jgi:tetratricopeptide (TPR) repeat protein
MLCTLTTCSCCWFHRAYLQTPEPLWLLVVAAAQVAVLAASIEAAAGEVNAARALFLRAYQLNKADKQLYMQWPRMEGACGNIERARLLFGYGLSLYPNNTKILNLYACFEEEQGEVELARELHQRALGIDSSSVTSMHNRCAWHECDEAFVVHKCVAYACYASCTCRIGEVALLCLCVVGAHVHILHKCMRLPLGTTVMGC